MSYYYYAYSTSSEALRDPLESVVAETLFANPAIRPEPQQMAELIAAGATEETIVAAAMSKGYMRPVMDVTLQDLDVSLPFMHHMSDLLATDHADDTIVFAGRDAEALYDDFAITHPEANGHLLPASSDLWKNVPRNEKQLVESFFGKFGLTSAAVCDSEKKIVLVDSGFYGRIALRLDEQLERLYGESVWKAGRMAIKLVCAEIDGIGEQILQLPDNLKVRWPKHDLIYTKYPGWASGNTYALAMSLQVMPRYHGSYRDLAAVDNDVIAVPASDEHPVKNIDRVEHVNVSVVNPLGAAVVQYRVVKAALERLAAGNVGLAPVITTDGEVLVPEIPPDLLGTASTNVLPTGFIARAKEVLLEMSASPA